MSDKPRLLVVEDDPGLQSQLRWALPEWEVELAGDREAALERFRRRPAPVVLLDLGLPPDPDGASEGLRCLRHLLATDPAARVVVASGNPERANAAAAAAAGAWDFLPKPFDPATLAATLSRHSASMPGPPVTRPGSASPRRPRRCPAS